MKSIALAIAIALAATTSQAALLGQSITAWEYTPFPSKPGVEVKSSEQTFIAAEGIDLNPFNSRGLNTLDVTDSSITLEFPGERMVGFDSFSGGIEFKINSPTITITSISVGGNTSKIFDPQLMPIDFNIDRVSWTSDSIRVDLRSMIAKQGAKIELIVSTSPIPEADTASLMALGLIFLGIGKHFKAKRIEA